MTAEIKKENISTNYEALWLLIAGKGFEEAPCVVYPGTEKKATAVAKYSPGYFGYFNIGTFADGSSKEQFIAACKKLNLVFDIYLTPTIKP